MAAWQHNQFTTLQKNVPQSWVVLNMDFAENYEIVHKIEIQSEHWSHQQVTLYIVIVHFRRKTTDDEQEQGLGK